MKRVAMGVAVLSISLGPALAQVPVNDAQVTTKETQTARCMLKARQYKKATLDPTQKVRGSVATAGSGGAVAAVGTSSVMGPTGAAGAATVAGIDFGALMSLGGGAATSVGVVNQVLQGVAAVAPAMQSNQSALEGVGQQIGSVDGVHGAWDQNAGARVNTGAAWGQAVQVGTTTMQLRNDALMRDLSEASATAKVMTFDAGEIRLVDDGGTIADNSVARAPVVASTGAVFTELKAEQAAARPDAGVDELWKGTDTPSDIAAALANHGAY